MTGQTLTTPSCGYTPKHLKALNAIFVCKFQCSLSAMDSQYFVGDMMPESASPVQQSTTVIEIRPFKGGWQCFEGPGVQPYWTGEHAKEDAIGCATARAKFGRGEIRVLNVDGSIQKVISFDESGKKL